MYRFSRAFSNWYAYRSRLSSYFVLQIGFPNTFWRGFMLVLPRVPVELCSLIIEIEETFKSLTGIHCVSVPASISSHSTFPPSSLPTPASPPPLPSTPMLCWLYHPLSTCPNVVNLQEGTIEVFCGVIYLCWCWAKEFHEPTFVVLLDQGARFQQNDEHLLNSL